MIEKIKDNKIFSFLLVIVSLFGIISSLNIKNASADNFGNGNGCVPPYCTGDFYDGKWVDVKGETEDSQHYNYSDPQYLFPLKHFFYIRNRYIPSHLRIGVRDFLKAEEQYIFHVKKYGHSYWSIPGMLTLDKDAGYDYSLPGKSLTESRRIYDALPYEQRNLVLNNPFVLYGKFSKPCESRGGACKCAIGETRPSYTKNQNKKTNDKSVTVDYSYRVVISPVKPKGFESLSKEDKDEWLKTHVTQELTPELTEAGKFIQKFNLGEIKGSYDSSEKWDSLSAKLKDLNNKEQFNSNVNLNSQNLKGFQRGGVYTITTYVKQVTVQASTSDIVRVDTSCVLTGTNSSDWKTKETVIKKTVSDANVDGSNNVKSVQISGNTGYSPRKSYQILNVRCNKTEFQKMVERTGSTVFSFGEGTASTAQSPVAKNRVATYYNDLNTDFFYNGKECNFKCNASPVGHPRGGNDSARNVQNNGDNTKNYGAQSSFISNNSFTFFRDNQVNLIRYDIWHPTSLPGDIAFNEAENTAYKTTVTLDPNGTPSGELFNFLDDSNHVLLAGTNLKSNNSVTLNGQYNKFGYQGAYSSEKDREQKTNLYHVYKVAVKTNVPTLGPNGLTNKTVQSTESLSMSCPNLFNTTDSVNAEIYNGPKEDNYKPVTRFNASSNRYTSVDFVKTSAE